MVTDSIADVQMCTIITIRNNYGVFVTAHVPKEKLSTALMSVHARTLGNYATIVRERVARQSRNYLAINSYNSQAKDYVVL